MTDLTQTHTDPIKYTIIFKGFCVCVLGVVLILLPTKATSTESFRYLHDLPMTVWGILFILVGVIEVLTAQFWWRFVLYPASILAFLMLVWAASLVAAATISHGMGAIGAVTWTMLAGLTWFAGRRAALTPDPNNMPGR